MKFEERMKLNLKSFIVFGRYSRWQTIMKRGRKEYNLDGSFKQTTPISLQEIEDTLNYLLKLKEKIKNGHEEIDRRDVGTGNETNRVDSITESSKISGEEV